MTEQITTRDAPAPSAEDREAVRRAVRAIYDVRRGRAGLPPITDADFDDAGGGYGDTWAEAEAAVLAARRPAPVDAETVKRGVLAARWPSGDLIAGVSPRTAGLIAESVVREVSHG